MSAEKADSRSTALFKEYFPRFAEVTLRPQGLFEDGHLGDVVLHILLKGQKRPINDYMWTVYSFRDSPLDFSFVYDPNKSKKFERQFEDALVEAIINGPLKGRRFFLEVSPQNWEVGYDDIRVNLRVEGEPIPGLQVPMQEDVWLDADDWKKLIPSKPERKAINIALELEITQNAGKASPSELSNLQAAMETAITAVALV